MAIGGAAGARRARVRRGTAAAAKEDPGRAARVAEQKERVYLEDLFARYDEHNQRALEFTQLSALLQEVNGGTALSEGEVKYVLHLGRNDASSTHSLTRGELKPAIAAMEGLQQDQRVIAARFAHYDSNGSGILEPQQVEQLLRDISGKPVSSEELSWIMRHADADSNQAIDLQELKSAIALWYANRPPLMPLRKAANKSAGCPSMCYHMGNRYLHTTRQAEQKERAESSSWLCCCGRRPALESYEYPGALSDEVAATNAP